VCLHRLTLPHGLGCESIIKTIVVQASVHSYGLVNVAFRSIQAVLAYERVGRT
jgi:hypothetical protein